MILLLLRYTEPKSDIRYQKMLMPTPPSPCSPEAEALAKSLSEIKQTITSYRADYHLRQGHDPEHYLQGWDFALKCIEAVVQAKKLFGSERQICLALADIDHLYPGAGSGYLAALGLSCGWEHQALPVLWSRVAEMARDMGSSHISYDAREGYRAKMRSSWEFPEEDVWTDQTLGWLLLNGPESMLDDSRVKHQNNPIVLENYYQLLKMDPNDSKELENSLNVFQTIVDLGGFSLGIEKWGTLRKMIYDGNLIGKNEYKGLVKNLGLQLESSIVSSEGFSNILKALSSMPEYASSRFGTNLIRGYLKAMSGGHGVLPKNPFKDISVNDGDCIKNLSAKLGYLTEFLEAHVVDGDIFLGSLILNNTIAKSYELRAFHNNDSHWIHSELLKDYDGNSNFKYGTRGVIYLKGLLLNLDQEKALEICSASDETRSLGYRITGNIKMLEGASEEVASNALSHDLGL